MQQIEKVALLKQYILDAPASQSEHQRAIGLLEGIMRDYSERIQDLENELEKLKNE